MRNGQSDGGMTADQLVEYRKELLGRGEGVEIGGLTAEPPLLHLPRRVHPVIQ